MSYSIASPTSSFGINLGIGSEVYDISTGKKYTLTAATLSTGTLGTTSYKTEWSPSTHGHANMVTTTGTPSSGMIPVYSGAATITGSGLGLSANTITSTCDFLINSGESVNFRVFDAVDDFTIFSVNSEDNTVTFSPDYAAVAHVGIGTNNPLGALNVNGGVHVGGDSDAGDNNLVVDGAVRGGDSVSGKLFYGKGSKTTSNLFQVTNDVNATKDSTVTITKLGYLGIATGAPAVPFHVNVNGASTRVGDGTNANCQLQFACDGTNNRAQVGYYGGYAVIQGGSTKGVQVNVNNNTFGSGVAATFATTGYLGLGTASNINSRLTLADHSTAAGGILFGTDVNLYRNFAGGLQTDNVLTAGGLILSGTRKTTLVNSASAIDKTITFPNATGTVALTSDLSGYVPTGGPYCSASKSSLSYTPALTKDVFTKIASAGDLAVEANSGFTIAGDSIRVLTAGNYEIHFSIVLYAASTDNFQIKLYKNNAAAGSGGRVIVSTHSDQSYSNCTTFWFLTAAANDYFHFRIANITDNDDPTITDYKLIFRIIY